MFKGKYGFLKEQNHIDKLRINFQLTISPEGDIINIEYVESVPAIDTTGIEDQINRELLTFINHYPKIFPGKFLTEKVYFKVLDFIEY